MNDKLCSKIAGFDLGNFQGDVGLNESQGMAKIVLPE